jgi:hypothetical protein
MTPNFAPLNQDAHRNLKINNSNDFAHVRDQHLAPIALHEFVGASSSLPVVFVKPGDEDKFHAVAMMGLYPGENLLTLEGKWNGIYVPTSVINYPFNLVRVPNKEEETFVLTIDENSHLLSETEGHPLFDEEGNATEILENFKKRVTDHFDQIQASRQFIDLLAEKGLLAENNVVVEPAGDKEGANIRGIYSIDETKLNELPSEEFEEFRKLGLLPVMYAQMASLHQIHRLNKINRDRTTA